MPVTFRLPHLAAVLLVAVTGAGAETPFTDPIPPAVVGRPLDQIKPARPAQQAPAAKPNRPRPLATTRRATPTKAPQTRTAAVPAVRTPAAPAARAPAAPAAVMGNAAAPRAAKEAVDDRADPRARAADDVGRGTRFARKPLDAGAYISSKYRALVRQYYEANPPSGKSAKWKIGEPVPRKATLTGVPDDLRARLPVVPPGHQYVQVGGEVVLLAVQSRMVVDGVSRSAR
jgi:Ni/Co efflux regulator RcnB